MPAGFREAPGRLVVLQSCVMCPQPPNKPECETSDAWGRQRNDGPSSRDRQARSTSSLTCIARSCAVVSTDACAHTGRVSGSLAPDVLCDLSAALAELGRDVRLRSGLSRQLRGPPSSPSVPGEHLKTLTEVFSGTSFAIDVEAKRESSKPTLKQAASTSASWPTASRRPLHSRIGGRTGSAGDWGEGGRRGGCRGCAGRPPRRRGLGTRRPSGGAPRVYGGGAARSGHRGLRRRPGAAAPHLRPGARFGGRGALDLGRWSPMAHPRSRSAGNGRLVRTLRNRWGRRLGRSSSSGRDLQNPVPLQQKCQCQGFPCDASLGWSSRRRTGS